MAPGKGKKKALPDGLPKRYETIFRELQAGKSAKLVLPAVPPGLGYRTHLQMYAKKVETVTTPDHDPMDCSYIQSRRKVTSRS